MLTKTKIICTMGPALESLESMLALIDAGMNVARLNFSHGTHEYHLNMIRNLKKAREMRGVPLALMLDTKGPEIRLGNLKNGIFPVVKGQKLSLLRQEVDGDENGVTVTPSLIFGDLEEGMTLLFDDGYISSKVVSKNKDGCVVEIENSGMLKSKKSVNIPGAAIKLPALTDKDVDDIVFGCREGIELVAASFIRSAEHVLEIKKLLKKLNKPEIQVFSKIENEYGVENFTEILAVSDGIMVARGDLGVEIPLKRVPGLQKMMIKKTYQAGKTVITATQMLESMINNPRPTRAEVSDVANAIYDSTSAIMLSGETAAGKYPQEAVKMMKNVAEEAEKDFPYSEFFLANSQVWGSDIPTSLAIAAVKTAYSIDAKAIFAVTDSGYMAGLISRFRPPIPIIALTRDADTYNRLAITWGVIPMAPTSPQDIKEAFSLASSFAKNQGLVKDGDLVIVVSAVPFKPSDTPNVMILDYVNGSN